MTAGTSLVVQWLRIHLPMQGTWVWSLVWEDPTCRRATKPVRHNYRARVMQLLKPACLEPMLRNKRSHHNEKPAHCSEELPLLAATRESPCTATKTQCRQEEKKNCKVKLLPLETKSFYTSIDGVISEKDLAPTYHYVAEDIEAQRG